MLIFIAAFFIAQGGHAANAPINQNGTWCSNEGGSCGFSGAKVVRFGSGERWVSKTMTGPVTCSVASFGSDPWPGWGKMCFVSSEVVPTQIGDGGAKWCSNEGGTCGFTGSRVIRFGSGARWMVKTLTGGTPCTVAAFGSDPYPNWGKMCFVTTDVVTAAPTPVPVPVVSAPLAIPFKLGVYEGSSPDALVSYETYLNRKMDYINATIPSENWANMTDTSLYWWFSKLWQPSGLDRVVLTIPMIPTFGVYSGPTLNDAAAAQALTDGANGANDAYFVKMRQTLIAAGYKTNIIRLGWEMNGNWYNWRANVNPTAWVAYWRRIVGILKADPAFKPRFDWNPTIQTQAIAAEKVYPGDDLVDFIGIDVYDSDWSRYPAGSNNPAVQREVWDKTILNGDHGLKFYAAFAKAHGKPLHIDEWDVGTPDGHQGGDNPYFVQSLVDWAKDPANRVELMMHYDDPSLQPDRTQFPNSSALLKKLFGK